MCCVVIFTMCAWILARLDLYLSRRILAFAAGLLVTPPTLVTLSLLLRSMEQDESVKAHWPKAFLELYRVMVPFVFLLHTCWIVFTVCVSRAVRFNGDKVALPTRFRSVLYLDVFGWLAEEQERGIAIIIMIMFIDNDDNNANDGNNDIMAGRRIRVGDTWREGEGAAKPPTRRPAGPGARGGLLGS